MDMLLFLLFGAYMTYLIYKSKRKPMDKWFGNNTGKNEVNGQANKELSEQQIKRVSIIQKALLEVNDTSLEETLNNFRKDLNRDSEIEIWEAIAGAWQHVFLQKPIVALIKNDRRYYPGLG